MLQLFSSFSFTFVSATVEEEPGHSIHYLYITFKYTNKQELLLMELAETKIKQQGYTDINFTLSYIMLLGNTVIVDAAECCTHLT